MTYKGSCLCNSVHWEFTSAIDGVTACNCTACHRYGALWAYDYENEGVKVFGETTHFYTRGNKNLEFHFCPTCACVICWRGTKRDDQGRRRLAVNVRLINEFNQIADIPIDHFDGFGAFDDLPRDGRCVKDMWF